jgi:hypothetical protein
MEPCGPAGLQTLESRFHLFRSVGDDDLYGGREELGVRAPSGAVVEEDERFFEARS